MRLNHLNKYNSLQLLSEDASDGPALDAHRYPSIRRHLRADFKPAIDIEDEIDDLRDMAGVEAGRSTGVVDDRIVPDEDEVTDVVVKYRRCQAAFRRLLQRLQLNAISGLRGANDYYRLSTKADAAAKAKSQFGGKDTYIVITADVDEMKYLNDKSGLLHSGVNSILRYIGDLIQESFNIENTKLFHPHGDEFRMISNLAPGASKTMNTNQVKTRFVRLLQACMEVSNKLASTGFYLEGWEDDRRVQPTISFGISTTDTAADAILTHVKQGGSSGKKMKYAITIDRDLRFSLGFSTEQLNQWINTIKRRDGSANVSVTAIEPPEVAVLDGGETSGGEEYTDKPELSGPQRRKLRKHKRGRLPRATERSISGTPEEQGPRLLSLSSSEDKNIIGVAIVEGNTPMDEARDRCGAVLLECSYSDIPDNTKKALQNARKEKIAYLTMDYPPGAMKVGNMYLPLKEKPGGRAGVM